MFKKKNLVVVFLSVKYKKSLFGEDLFKFVGYRVDTGKLFTISVPLYQVQRDKDLDYVTGIVQLGKFGRVKLVRVCDGLILNAFPSNKSFFDIFKGGI